jgi:hypothetical protein
MVLSTIAIGITRKIRKAVVSRPSGIPSKRRHTPATAAQFLASSVNPGSTAAARSVNNRTASYRSSSAGDAGRSSAGIVIGGTATVTSPATPSTCRLVAIMCRPGQPRNSASVVTAHASARCSHWSSTSSRHWGSR